MKQLWRVTVDIREAASGYAYPVVRHIFFGRTKAEALGYYRSHLRSDAFLRDCVQKGQYGPVTCRATLRVTSPA